MNDGYIYKTNVPIKDDYVLCKNCGDVVNINMSEIYTLLKSIEEVGLKMDFSRLLEVVKASQVATLRTQIIMLTQLGDNTNTSYASAIAAINEQIAKIQAL